METNEIQPSKRSAEDHRLIESAITGNEKAYQKLMMKYRKSVYYLIFKMVRNPQDAEDLTQETFVKAFSSLAKFDTRYAFSTWIFKIASNNTIDFIRKQRMQTYSINESINTEDGVNNPLQIEDTGLIAHDIVMRDQRKQYLAIAIAKLPERYQQLITLRYFEEYSYEEVAEHLKVPLGTVKAQLHRARELLNEELSRIEHSL